MMFWLLMGALVCLVISSVSTGVLWDKMLGHKEEAKLLEAENEKLCFALLDEESKRKKLESEKARGFLPPPPMKTKIEELLEAIRDDMRMTGTYSELHDEEEVNEKFLGLNPLVTYEFDGGIVKVRELVDNPNIWEIDLIYKGELMAGLQQEHRDALRDMLPNKIAEAALKDLEK